MENENSLLIFLRRIPLIASTAAALYLLPAGAQIVHAPQHRPWIGLAANPFANETLTPATVKARFEQSLEAGVNYIYISPKWNEIEVSKGRYKFDSIDFHLRQAREYKLPAVLHLRVIDTNQRSMPSDLMSADLRGNEPRDRLLALIDAVMPRLAGNVHYMLLGNEVDSYFRAHPGEIESYAGLYAAAAARIRRYAPEMQVSVSIGYGGLDMANSRLNPLLGPTDFFAVTYYGMTPDFLVKPATSATDDLDRILSAAGRKQVLLQETGYPSSPVNDSSETKQAGFFAAVLDEIAKRGDRIIGANFLFMSDFSDAAADGFVAYYKAPNANRFRAYLKTLGMFDDQGRPKKSWSLFENKAPFVSGANLKRR